MIHQEVVIENTLGLHARAAARFVQTAERFKSRITVTRENRSTDGKSILGLLALLVSQGSRMTIAADGPDESAALRALVDLVAARFGEER